MKISIALIALNIATVFMVLAAPGIMRDPELVLIKSKLDGLVR